MNKKIGILHLEDSLNDSELIHSIIESGEIGNKYFLAENENDFLNFLDTENIDIILSDYSLPDYNGNEALKVVREKYPNIPFIFVSGAMGEDRAIDAMLNGATDYVLKNKLERLVPAIKRALYEHELAIKQKQAEINLKEKNEQIKAQNVKYAQINKVLAFQNDEKEKRAAELILANKELIFQNEEKEKRAAELIIANKELVFQKAEKGKRAAELVIADKEIVIQHEEKEKQEAANKELEAFCYSISHDLRAPLRHIGGFVDLLIKNNSSQLNETGLRYLNIISESSHEMGNLIDALLTFSRLSGTEVRRTKINSKNMATRVLKTFSEELIGRNVEINISELPETRGDEDLINQVWVNLISNAIKYSRNEEKAVIDIGGKIEDGTTIFYIKDNGAGFDMKYADKLFGVFQRLHKTRDFEGIGIGLANVNRIVTRHGGKCWAEGEVAKGATFFFSLPNN